MFEKRGGEPMVPTQSKIYQSITRQTKTGFISMTKNGFRESIIHKASTATYLFLKLVYEILVTSAGRIDYLH